MEDMIELGRISSRGQIAKINALDVLNTLESFMSISKIVVPKKSMM